MYSSRRRPASSATSSTRRACCDRRPTTGLTKKGGGKGGGAAADNAERRSRVRNRGPLEPSRGRLVLAADHRGRRRAGELRRSVSSDASKADRSFVATTPSGGCAPLPSAAHRIERPAASSPARRSEAVPPIEPAARIARRSRRADRGQELPASGLDPLTDAWPECDTSGPPRFTQEGRGTTGAQPCNEFRSEQVHLLMTDAPAAPTRADHKADPWRAELATARRRTLALLEPLTDD